MSITDETLEKYKNAKSLSDDYLKFGDRGTAGSVSGPALEALADAKSDLASSDDPKASTLIADINEKENEVQDKLAEDRAYNPPVEAPEDAPNKNFMPKSGLGNSVEGPDENFAPNDGENFKPRLDPSESRLAGSGASKGIVSPAPAPKTPSIRYSSGSENTGEIVPTDEDWRIRVSVGQSSDFFYKSSDPGIMKPLTQSNGVIFPYTPSVSITYSAGYSSQKNTHSNYPAYSYDSSEVQAIQISGDFTVQNQSEGEYLLAVIYFFRSASKMFYGTGRFAGNPPPVLFLNGYGRDYLPNVPCVLTTFTHTMPSDIDYMGIDSNGLLTRMPTSSQITISLQPVYSRSAIAKFDLENFSRGRLLGSLPDGGFI
jgi:hypothetical protein